MKCFNCGQRMDPEDEYCAECGTPVDCNINEEEEGYFPPDDYDLLLGEDYNDYDDQDDFEEEESFGIDSFRPFDDEEDLLELPDEDDNE